MPERLLDTNTVAARIGISRTKLHYMVQRGEFPAPIKIGRASRWREADVDKWITDGAAAVVETPAQTRENVPSDAAGASGDVAPADA